MIAFDTNVLVYAFDTDAADKNRIARALLQAAPHAEVRLPLQVLGELYAVLTRRRIGTRTEAREIVDVLLETLGVCLSDEATFCVALAIAETDGLTIWDAQIISASAAAGCKILISEDLQDGRRFVLQEFGSIQIINPFDVANSALLQELGLSI